VVDAFGYKPNFYPRGFIRVNRDLAPTAVERTLRDLRTTTAVLDEAISMLRLDDPAAAAIAADRLGDVLSDRAAITEAILTRTSSEPPREQKVLQRRLERNPNLAAGIKALYQGRCQRCGFTFQKPDGTQYAEAAHLRPISLREADLDVKDNILILCPNHHKMLDFGAMSVEYDSDSDTLFCREGEERTILENRHIGEDRPER
jgi:hypothetical protein